MSNLSLFSTMLDCPVKHCKMQEEKTRRVCAYLGYLLQHFGQRCGFVYSDIQEYSVDQINRKNSGLEQDTFSYLTCV